MLRLVLHHQLLHIRNTLHAVLHTKLLVLSIVFYRGEDAADEFICVLQREAEELSAEFIDVPQEMEFSASDEINFEMATVRHICNQFLADDRVRDHCHFTGLYRGAAHNACNLNYRIHSKSWKLPVVLHNLKGYEGHLIVQSLKSEFGKVRVIPQNMESIYLCQ